MLIGKLKHTEYTCLKPGLLVKFSVITVNVDFP